MDNLVPAASRTEEPSSRKRNHLINSSLHLAPTTLTLSAGRRSSSASTITDASSSDDLEMFTIKPNPQSYTSLKDLLPSAAAVNSPKPSVAHSAKPGSEISIRNRLVKQAAWAYLQPMSSPPGPTGVNFFQRLWPRVEALFGLLCANVVTALNWTLGAFRIRIAR